MPTFRPLANHRRPACTLALACLAALAPARAYAVDADTFDSTGSTLDEQGGLQLVAPTLGDANDIYGGLELVYAHDPLVQVFGDGTRTVVIASQFGTHIMGGYTVAGLARIDLDIPVYPYVGGSGLTTSGPAMGDIRAQGVIKLLDAAKNGLGLAVVPSFSVPTASPAADTGSGSVTGGVTMTGGFHPNPKFSIDGNLGVNAAKPSTLGAFRVGSALTGGVGAGLKVAGPVLLGLELDGQIGLVDGIGQFNKNPIEGHIYGTYGHGNGWTGTLGIGTGIVAGVGAPDFRAILGVGYHKAGKVPVKDTDGDGIMDDVDQCIDVPEDKDGFQDEDGCPDPDNDQDGILDAKDSCPNAAEDVDGFQDDDGCPDLDNDKDGLPDTKDQCPDDAGPVELNGCPDKDGDKIIDSQDECPTEPGPLATHGCPDRDNDLVPDKRDKCPDVPKDPREDPARSDGCPKRVIVTAGKIEILDKVFFDTNKTTIKAVSFPLLDAVAKTLNDNMDLTKVEVAGHTDSDGDDAKNLKLSQGRAQAVVTYLVTKGKVDAARLTAVGYGETKPIDTNGTPEGKANNRRVEFTILAQGNQAVPPTPTQLTPLAPPHPITPGAGPGQPQVKPAAPATTAPAAPATTTPPKH